MEEHFCPKCGAILNEQSGFDPDCGAWTCQNCGQQLMDDHLYDGDVYKGIVWYCDNCDAVLNKQFGFSDTYDTWDCTECGHSNEINEENIFESKEEYLESVEEDFVSDVASSVITNLTDEAKKVYEENQRELEFLETVRKQEEKIESEKRRAWRRKHRKEITIAIIVTITFLLFLSLYIINSQLIPIKYEHNELVGINYEIVVDKLQALGFTNIKVEEISDLKLNSESKEDIVTEIIIRNRELISTNKKFFPNEKITIIYHTLEKITIPLTSKEAKGLQYSEVVKKFEQAGFLNIKTEVIYDIVTEWFNKDGEVDSVQINGNKNFSTSDECRLDAEVIITYHTFKKNKPK